jgi:hypothetical protein
VSTSKVVTAFTSSAGARSITLLTMAPMRTRSVCAAMNPRAVYASSMSSAPEGAVGSAWMRWSAIHTVSTPACSAAPASHASSAPSRAGPLGQV